MTDQLRARIALFKDLVFLGSVIAAILSVILTVMTAGIIALWGPQLRDTARDWLGVADNAARIQRLSGESRVTRQEPGASYVREPVRLGDPVTLVLVIGRTEVGAGCRLIEIVPLFTDDQGVTQSGTARRPTQQLGPQIVRRELDLPQPENLIPGRTLLQLQLEYTCGSRSIFETTDPVSYYALPRDPAVD